MPFKTIVVEDIPATRQAIIHRVSENPDLTVVADFGSVQETTDYLLNGGEAEVIFLDVRLFGDYGWEVLRTLRRENMAVPPVIIITAEEEKGQAQTAFREFREEVVDYICKPFDHTWVDYQHQCVRRIRQRREQMTKSRPKLNRLPVSYGNTTNYIPVQEITCLLKTTDLGLIVYFANGQRRFVDPYGSLGNYQENLHRDNFVRCHRSAVVNMDYISSVRKEGSKLIACLTAGEVTEIECSTEGGKALRGRLRWGNSRLADELRHSDKYFSGSEIRGYSARVRPVFLYHSCWNSNYPLIP